MKSEDSVEFDFSIESLIFSVTGFLSLSEAGNGTPSRFRARRILVEITVLSLLFLYQIMTVTPLLIVFYGAYLFVQLCRRFVVLIFNGCLQLCFKLIIALLFSQCFAGLRRDFARMYGICVNLS